MSEFTPYVPGQRIADRYIVHFARNGVMGEVYLCLDEQQKIPIALKMLHLEGFDGESERAQLEQHLGSWLSITPHPNIVRCISLEVVDARPVIVMDWIAGELARGISVRDWLRHVRMLSLSEALHVSMDLCRGLAHAASCVPGLVHQDLKPENVLVAQGPVAKVGDFGVAGFARSLDDAADADSGGSDSRAMLTQLSGTPWYMAPEQWLEQPLDARTDIYAMGCILHEMLTGHRPYEIRKLPRLRSAHLNGALPGSDTHEHLPDDVSRIILRCMQKSPNDRFEDLGALTQALETAYARHVSESLPIPSSREAVMAAAFNNRGIAFARMGLNGVAIADFDRALHAQPTSAAAHVNRADTLRTMGRLEQASNDYDRAVAIDDRNVAAYIGRGIALSALGNTERALADFERALTLAPHDPRALCERGSALAETGRFDEALVEYRRAIAVNERSSDAHRRRGVLLTRLGHHDEAAEDLNRAVELAPGDVRPLKARIALNEIVGNHDQALVDCTRIIKRNPRSAVAYIDRGRVLKAMGRFEEALLGFQRAGELEPRSVDAWCACAATLALLDRNDEALADYRRAIELDADSIAALHGRGHLLLTMGRANDALADLQKVVALEPTLAEAFNDLGGALDTLGRDREALANYQRAAELKPDLAAAHLNIGVHYGKQERLDAALPYFQKAANLGDARAERYAQAAMEQLGGGSEGELTMELSPEDTMVLEPEELPQPEPPTAPEPAPAPAPVPIVTPQNFAVDVLISLLDRAQIRYEMSPDGRITVVERYRFWLLPEARTPARYIRLITAFEFSSGISPGAALTLANRINVEVATVRAAAMGSQLVLDQYLWLEGGIHAAHLVHQIRTFPVLVEEAMRRNTDGIVR